MKLRIEGDNREWRVVNAETGDVLEGVRRVKWDSDRSIGGATIELSKAAIDLSVPAEAVTAYGSEDGKYARSRLLDVAGLRWRR